MAKSPANELTGQILEFLLRLPKTFAWRQNTQGILSLNGTWRPSAKRGVSDLLACVHGTMLAIEVKIGADRLRPEQVSFLESVRMAGGVAIVVKDYEDFIRQFNDYTKKIPTGWGKIPC